MLRSVQPGGLAVTDVLGRFCDSDSTFIGVATDGHYLSRCECSVRVCTMTDITHSSLGNVLAIPRANRRTTPTLSISRP